MLLKTLSSKHLHYLSFTAFILYALCKYISTSTSTMNPKRMDNLAREVVDLPFVIEGTDSCDYEDSTKDYTWTDSDFVTLNLNIRGLYSKLSDLAALIQRIEKGGTPPTVITISETWLTKNSPNFTIPGYKIYRKDRDHKRGGGVAILVDNRLTSRALQTDTDLTVVESCAVEIKTTKKPIIVCSLYRPPNTDIKMFLRSYRLLVAKLQKMSTDIIIGLDHNLDFLKKRETSTY